MSDKEAASTASLIIDILNWVFSNLVLLGIESYYLYRIVKASDSVIIRKRKPGIVVISISCLLLYIVINSTFATLLGQRFIHTDSVLLTQITYGIWICASLPLWYIYVYFSCSRYWLLFYDIHFAVSCSKKAWHSIIDASLSSQTDDFYLHRKQTFGSWTYIKPRLLCLVCLLCCLSVVSLVLLTIYSVPLSLVIVLLCVHLIASSVLPLIVCVCIACKIPAFDDNICLREELKFCNLMFVSMMFVLLLYQMSFIVARHHFERDVNARNFLWASQFLLFRIALFLVNLKQTRWPLKRFRSVIKRYSSRTVMDLAHQKTSACIEEEVKCLRPPHAHISIADDDDDDDDDEEQDDVCSMVSGSPLDLTVSVSLREEMKNTLQDSRVFEKFMQRLLKEHCAECMLSIVEFLQFRTQCYAASFCYDEHGDIGKGNVMKKSTNEDIDDEAEQPMELEPICSARNTCNIGYTAAQLVLPTDAQFPRSCIVFRPQHMRYEMMSNPKQLRFTVKDFKLMARELYKKYIAVNSEFEINIDGLTRRKYRKLFENVDAWITNQTYNEYKRLSTVFDVCVEQMTSLITASFVNWKNSMEFDRIQKQIVHA